MSVHSTIPTQRSRREFLRQLTVLGGVALVLPAVAEAGVTWAPAGDASRFQAGRFTRVTLPDKYNAEELYVTRTDDGPPLALWSRCTHKGCLVDWRQEERQFECPCHRGRYDAAGKNIGGPPPQPLRRLQTKVDAGGILWVEVPG